MPFCPQCGAATISWLARLDEPRLSWYRGGDGRLAGTIIISGRSSDGLVRLSAPHGATHTALGTRTRRSPRQRAL